MIAAARRCGLGTLAFKLRKAHTIIVNERLRFPGRTPRGIFAFARTTRRSGRQRAGHLCCVTAASRHFKLNDTSVVLAVQTSEDFGA